MNNLKLSMFILLGISQLSYANTNANEGVFFDPDFLELDENTQIDITRFQSGENNQLPGEYYVDIYVNDKFLIAKQVDFIKSEKDNLQPCLTYKDLIELNIKINDFLGDSNGCVNLSVIPDAKSNFAFSEQRLYLSIPQIAISSNPSGYVDLDSIDNGVNGVILNYSYSGSNFYEKNNNSTTNNNYLNLRPGINFGAWRYRNYTTWSNNNSGSGEWDSVYNYLSRNINRLKSQLILGDSISPSNVFDSVPFRGIQLATDDEMYPESLRGYAPIVRGIANSNAEIIIRQNGYVIYQANVAAGPFEISDLYPTGSSGDLYVTVKESNGAEQTQIVPFASLPVLQREGRLSYSITSGQYRAYDNDIEKKIFGQFSFIYGLFQKMTVYGGSQLSRDYQSYAIGVGQNLGQFGAISFDITQANSNLGAGTNTKQQGQSYRFRYNKNINNIGTNIALAGYRYSTKGFYSLAEVFDTYRNSEFLSSVERRKNRGEITLSQNIGDSYGSIALSYVNEDYWNSGRKTQSLSMGYNNSWKGISYGLAYTYNQNTNKNGSKKYNQRDNLFTLNVSIPFSYFDSSINANFSANINDYNSRGIVGLSASQLDNQLNWGIQQGIANKGEGAFGNINASYKSRYGELTAGTGYTKDNHNIYYGMSGSAVLHKGGVTLGQQLSETAALVEIPGGKDIPIENYAGVVTDGSGYALVPYTSPYRKNTLNINTQKLPENTEMDYTSQVIYPSRGAIAKASMNANVGYRALITLMFKNGKEVPFGAQAVFTENQQLNNIVGDNGEVYLSGLKEKGNFIVEYNENQRCTVRYTLSNMPNYLGLYTAKATCD